MTHNAEVNSKPNWRAMAHRLMFFGDRRHRPLLDLFDSWNLLLSRFEKILRHHSQLPYTFHERTNSSILASAASLHADFMALQEFAVKRRTIKDRLGRGDVWIEDDRGQWSYDVECKIVFRSLRTSNAGNLRRALKSATAQIRSLGRRGYRTHSIALVFLVPQLSVADATADKVNALWVKFVDSLREPKTLGADFVAIHRGDSKAVRRAAEDHSQTWNPGVAAVGKIVYRGER